MAEQQPIEVLYAKYLQGLCTQEELETLYAYFRTSDEAQLKALIETEFEQTEEAPATDLEQEKLVALKSLIDQRIKPVRRLWPRIAAAASILIACSVVAYFVMHQTQPVQVAVNTEQIAPVQKGVFLTLSNGQKLKLDKQHQGRTKVADGTQVDESADELSYQPSNEASASQSHTLTNNSSNKYSLVLADGSEVFLDMASSITYPVTFNGKDRKVSITGQVYFKVKHNAAQPFSVTANEQTIEDIGTEFNIDAYGKVRTTLVRGAVRVRAGAKAVILKPGEESRLENNVLVSLPADLEMSTIWLQGRIPLNHRTLEDVLAEVGRIYDVSFAWQDESLKRLKFGGAVSRTQKLSNVLNFFRNTGKVDFMVNGKTVTVIRKKK